MKFENWLKSDDNDRGESNSAVLKVEVDGFKLDQSVLYWSTFLLVNMILVKLVKIDEIFQLSKFNFHSSYHFQKTAFYCSQTSRPLLRISDDDLFSSDFSMKASLLTFSDFTSAFLLLQFWISLLRFWLHHQSLSASTIVVCFLSVHIS